MNKKYIVIGGKQEVSKEDKAFYEQEKQTVLNENFNKKRSRAFEKLKADANIIAPEKRVIVSIDTELKNNHTFTDGTTIRLERKYNNLNQRETQPVNGIVINSQYIPKGATVLLHHNASHDVNKIFNYNKLSGDDINNEVQYFSVPESQVYLWKVYGGEWQPCEGFATGLRVFIPYKGIIEGILPTIVENTLYITSGEFKGKVCHTLKSCDYELIFQGDNGQEQRVIRCRHYEDSEIHDREELTAVSGYLTDLVNKGEYFVGLSNKDCKQLK